MLVDKESGEERRGMTGEGASERAVGGEVDHVGEHEEAVDEVEVGGGASCRALGVV